VRAALFWGYAAAGAAYLVWRAAMTLSGAPPVYAALFYLAEVHLFLSSLVFYRLLAPPDLEREHPTVPDAVPSLDVLIATYREDVDLVRTTAVAARDMDLPHRTFLCDDGDRPEMAALAQALGIGYFARGVNTDFKAGNLNHALARTDGELVLFLDADHVPRRQLLTRLVGWFEDLRVGFVQVPQVYYNVDSFQHVEVAQSGTLWHESSIFQHRMQNGAAIVDGPLFVGTGALMRRSALDAIEGIATGTITEDVHTSMRLHAAGFRSVHVDEALGVLLAPDTPYAYARQRLRWAQGAMQILRRENPLWKQGLSWPQRVAYFATWMGFLASYPLLLFYLAPALYVLFDLAPVSVDAAVGVPIIAAHVAWDLAVYRLLGAPEARFLFGERFRMTTLSVNLRASLRLLKPDGLVFLVTPKGPHTGLPAWVWLPVAGLLLLNGAAVVVGMSRLYLEVGHPVAITLAVVFAAHFAVVAVFALANMLRHRSAAESHAIPVSVPTRAWLPEDEEPVDVHVVRLAGQFGYLRAQPPHPPGTRLRLDLSPIGLPEPIDVVVEGTPEGRADLPARFGFSALTSAERDRLDHYLFDTAVPSLLSALADAPFVPPPDPVGEATRLPEMVAFPRERVGVSGTRSGAVDGDH
jgi:cellulose synthase (UDP-forming)